MSNIYHKAITAGLEDAFSLERFQRYINWANGDRREAYHLYALNTQISEVLYTPLQMLEIVLRNRFHIVLSNAYGEFWFDQPDVLKLPHQIERLDRTKSEIVSSNKKLTAGAIVSTLTFGFWTGLLSPAYENLWQQVLHRAAKRQDGKGLTRKALIAPLNPIRVLRNRIAHHEPILMWDLPKHHSQILQIIMRLSPIAYEWSQYHSRFGEIYPKDGFKLFR